MGPIPAHDCCSPRCWQLRAKAGTHGHHHVPSVDAQTLRWMSDGEMSKQFRQAVFGTVYKRETLKGPAKQESLNV